jgi:hypothetical protein
MDAWRRASPAYCNVRLAGNVCSQPVPPIDKAGEPDGAELCKVREARNKGSPRQSPKAPLAKPAPAATPATRNFIGKKVVQLWEGIVTRIPVVNSIYSSVKQVSDTLFSSSGNAFRKAVLVEYPRKGSWTIAFLTGVPGGDVRNHLRGDYISIYVPTTPNPTSGFFLMVPRADAIELDMNVDEALKYIVSMGVVSPEHFDKKILIDPARLQDRAP